MLSADDITRLQGEFDTFRTDVARPLARARQTTSADVYRSPAMSSNKRGAPTQVATGILLHIAAPSAQGLQLLADLGAERANVIGELAYDANVTEGDELHVGAVVYQVERAARRADMTLCALWELKR